MDNKSIIIDHFLGQNNKPRSTKVILRIMESSYPNLLLTYKNSGISYMPEFLYLTYHNLDKQVCPTCKTNTPEFVNFNQGYREYCSSKCAASNPEVISKKTESQINKYGSLGFDTEKTKETILSRYGVTHYSKSKQFKESLKKTQKNNHGSYAFHKEGVSDKAREAKFKRFEKRLISYLEKDTTLRWLEDQRFKGWYAHSGGKSCILYKAYCSKCNQIVEFDVGCFCLQCNPRRLNGTASLLEKELLEFIQQNYTGTILTSYRSLLEGKEIDIYLPDLDLAFEFNGAYYHSSLHKDKYYHQNKTDISLEKGVSLIHIWDYDWLFKTSIVKSRVLNLLNKTPIKLNARSCEVKEVDHYESTLFLDLNHLHGSRNSTRRIGLYYKENLVSLLTLSEVKGSLEIDRFVSKVNTVVRGAFGKLISKVNQSYPIFTYIDRDWTPDHTKSVYFRYLKTCIKTEPNLVYYNQNTSQVTTWHSMQKHKISIPEGAKKDSYLISQGILPVYRSNNFRLS